MYFDVWLLSPWMRMTLCHGQAIKWAKAKVHIFDDSVLWEEYINLQKQTPGGKNRFIISNNPTSTKNCLELMENQLSSSEIFPSIHIDWDSRTIHYQLSMYGAASSWWQDFSGRMQGQESTGENMSSSEENEKSSQQLNPQGVGSLARSTSNFAQYVKKKDSSEQFQKECITRLAMMWTMDLGILLHHAESTLCLEPILILTQNFGHSRTQRLVLFLLSKLSVNTMLRNRDSDPSTAGDNTKVWVVISRSSMDELRHRESENLPEEVATEGVQDQDKEHSWDSFSSKKLGALACRWVQSRIQLGNPSLEICQ